MAILWGGCRRHGGARRGGPAGRERAAALDPDKVIYLLNTIIKSGGAAMP